MKIRRIRSASRFKRELTSQENQLWTEATKLVVKSKRASINLQIQHLQQKIAQTNVVQSPSPGSVRFGQSTLHQNFGAAIDKKMQRRLRRGEHLYEQTLDLHGMTQREAHNRLRNFLIRAQIEGAQLVLVITGRGALTPDASGRGVLRRHVPEWLHSYREVVVGFEEAPTRLGGGGALLVRIRRAATHQGSE